MDGEGLDCFWGADVDGYYFLWFSGNELAKVLQRAER